MECLEPVYDHFRKWGLLLSSHVTNPLGTQVYIASSVFRPIYARLPYRLLPTIGRACSLTLMTKKTRVKRASDISPSVALRIYPLPQQVMLQSSFFPTFFPHRGIPWYMISKYSPVPGVLLYGVCWPFLVRRNDVRTAFYLWIVEKHNSPCAQTDASRYLYLQTLNWCWQIFKSGSAGVGGRGRKRQDQN